nr:carbohydrate kinase [Knoellia sp. DB2414S]
MTQREREIVELLRAEPLLDAAGLAERVGSTKAAVAVHLSNLTRKGVIVGRGYVLRPDEGAVVVVGGTNMDIKAQSRAALALRTSNPGETTSTPGGVGRNIAENLARLGSPTQLVSPVGRDAFGDQVLDATRAAGVGLDHVIRGEEPTGTYLAVLDADGELVVAVSTMGATDGLTVDQLTGVRDLVANADLLVVDGNIPAAPTTWLLDTAAAADVPVVIDPVSVAKARPLATILSPDRPVLALTPNLDELAAIVGEDVPDTKAGIARAAASLHGRGVAHVWVRRGARGSVLSSRAVAGAHTEAGSRPEVHLIPAPPTTLVDVTGAGDAMTAAFVHAHLRGDSALGAVRFGQTAAALTVACPQTVRPDLTARLVDAELRRTGVGRADASPTTRRSR